MSRCRGILTCICNSICAAYRTFSTLFLLAKAAITGTFVMSTAPELALFESGVYVGKRKITNTSACPEIPKIGLCNSDAYCVTRNVFLSDMDQWGIETFFTISMSMAEYTPEIAGDLFVWPNFVDAGLYRDYGESKIIPVLITGSHASHYPWRNRISRIMTQFYPALSTPHFWLAWEGPDLSNGFWRALRTNDKCVSRCADVRHNCKRPSSEAPRNSRMSRLPCYRAYAGSCGCRFRGYA